MPNFLNIDGTVEGSFKIGGPQGPQAKNNSGAFQFRNSADSADANISAATATLATADVSTSIVFNESTNDLTVVADDQTGGARTATFPNLGGNDEITFNTQQQTLANKTLTTPTIVSTGSIIDGNGNAYVVFEETGSAVAEVKIKNASTGLNPEIIGQGETNTGLNLVCAGTGAVIVASTDAGQAGKLRLADNDSNATVGFEASATTTSYDLRFPAGIGSANQILKIDSIAGSTAVLSFANQAAGAAGAQQVIRLTRAGSSGAGNQDSTTTLPANTIVQQVLVNVTGALNNTPTLQVGLQGGAANAFMDTGDSDLTAVGVYSKFIDTSIGGSADEIRITVGGTPNTGNFAVSVVYCELPNN